MVPRTRLLASEKPLNLGAATEAPLRVCLVGVRIVGAVIADVNNGIEVCIDEQAGRRYRFRNGSTFASLCG